MRQWVVSGLSESLDWTPETERQFALAESVACSAARTYANAGIVAIVDHCRNLNRLNEILETEFAGQHVLPVCLMPSLTANLARNDLRTNKSFPTEVLIPTIEGMNPGMLEAETSRWLVHDSSSETAEETALAILAHFTDLISASLRLY